MTVSLLDDASRIHDLPSDGTVRDLMLASALHVGLSCEIQRLVYDGSQLDPDAPLPAMADDTAVHVVLRARSLKIQLANEAAGGVIPHPDAPAEMRSLSGHPSRG